MHTLHLSSQTARKRACAVFVQICCLCCVCSQRCVYASFSLYFPFLGCRLHASLHSGFTFLWCCVCVIVFFAAANSFFLSLACACVFFCSIAMELISSGDGHTTHSLGIYAVPRQQQQR
eukprot:Opistho-2@84089